MKIKSVSNGTGYMDEDSATMFDMKDTSDGYHERMYLTKHGTWVMMTHVTAKTTYTKVTAHDAFMWLIRHGYDVRSILPDQCEAYEL